MDHPNIQKNKNEALAQLMRLCSRQEKCTYDIRKKLEDWKLPEEDAGQIVHQLKEEKFLDDERFTRFFVRDKFALNKWGRQKIKYMLLARHIDKIIVEDALQQLSEDEYQQTLANELHKKRKQLTGNNNYQLRAKLFNFATQRGFESDLVYKTIDRILNSDN